VGNQELRIVMPSRNNPNIRQEFHVGDCYVWSEINYLDSQTNYREYLPQNASPVSSIASDDLVMLDSPWHVSNHGTLLHLGFLVTFLLVLWLLWYVLQYL
jgi:hypothetical protein